MRISDVMTKNPATCTPSSSSMTAASLMQQKDTGALPVTEDAFSRKLVGVVTDRDLCLIVVASGRDPSHVWVQECMTGNPVTVHPDDEVSKAVRLMREHQVRRIPVVNARNEIQGMVSLADLVRHKAIKAEELFELLEKICQPAVEPKKPRAKVASAA